jgi:nicotine blue oxidoreductase
LTNPAPEPEAILVLAAGRGRRAGGPKALHPVAGAPWWRQQQEALSRLGMPTIWVISRPVAEAWRTEADSPRAVVADDTTPMFESVLTGILALRATAPAGVFILPVDVPAAEPSVWRTLAAERSRPARPAFHGVHGHPLRVPWCFVERDILPLANDPARAAAARLDRLIAPHVATIPVDDERVVLNLNEPSDFARWERARSGR